MLEKVAYLDEQGIEDKDERRRALRFISALDTTYVSHYIAQLKAARHA